ncbi:MAG: Holliday junction branch migration protein RuvA [Clostridia bacterium]|nr:Holliday junction branch migration protein RuvA [Clostridia bacterium]
MIAYIKGVVTQTLPGSVVIENNNIGYCVHVPDNSSAYLTKDGEIITLYTAMLVREDDISLYGFTDTQSLAMFNLLLTVNGIGAKAALAILSALSLSELKKAIAFEDAALITKANGVGKKTAQRVCLELKDKVGPAEDIAGGISEVNIEKGSPKEDALAALMSLGYSKTEAMSALIGITEKDLSAEEYIKRALRSRR